MHTDNTATNLSPIHSLACRNNEDEYCLQVSTITFYLYLIVLIWEKVLAMLIAIALVQKKKAIKV